MKYSLFFSLSLCVLGISLQGMGRRQPISSGKPYNPRRTRPMHVAASHGGHTSQRVAAAAAPVMQVRRELPTLQRVAAAAAPVEQVRSELPLPTSLSSLKGVSIHHIVVTQQGPNQCGSRAVANALAVQDVIMSGQPLNSSIIRAQAAQYDRILVNRALEWSEVANLARRNKLFNAHIMARMPKEQTDAEYPYVVYSTDGNQSSINDLAASLLMHGRMTAHIICNTGGHWVLVTIIKQEGRMPQILYMDSCNGRLQDNSAATKYICYLANTCLA